VEEEFTFAKALQRYWGIVNGEWWGVNGAE